MDWVAHKVCLMTLFISVQLLRRLHIHFNSHLNASPEHGLLELLSGYAVHPKSLLHTEASTGLSYILGSRAAEVPTDQLILGSEFKRLMKVVSAP